MDAPATYPGCEIPAVRAAHDLRAACLSDSGVTLSPDDAALIVRLIETGKVSGLSLDSAKASAGEEL